MVSKALGVLTAAGLALVPVAAMAEAVTLVATLSGANETGGGDSDGTGRFSAEIDTETGDVCYVLVAEKTAKPVTYYAKMPADIANGPAIVVDPMLATGGSAVHAVALLREKGVRDIQLVCLVAAPEGIRAMQSAHPDVMIHVASVDERLNERFYIVPGLGDAGDRIFGTM